MNKRKRLLLSIFLVVILTCACTPSQPVSTATTPPPSISTSTPLPTAQLPPTSTASPTSTNTPVPSPTETVFPFTIPEVEHWRYHLSPAGGWIVWEVACENPADHCLLIEDKSGTRSWPITSTRKKMSSAALNAGSPLCIGRQMRHTSTWASLR